MYEAMRPQKAHIVCNTHQHQSDKLSTFYLHNLDLIHTFISLWLWQQQLTKNTFSLEILLVSIIYLIPVCTC